MRSHSILLPYKCHIRYNKIEERIWMKLCIHGVANTPIKSTKMPNRKTIRKTSLLNFRRRTIFSAFFLKTFLPSFFFLLLSCSHAPYSVLEKNTDSKFASCILKSYVLRARGKYKHLIRARTEEYIYKIAFKDWGKIHKFPFWCARQKLVSQCAKCTP